MAPLQTAAEKDLEQLQSEWEKGLQKTNEKVDKLQTDLKQALEQAQREAEEAV
jgi:hypothetical protein